MKLLIIGKNGFIGKNLNEYLTQNSTHEIHAVGHEELDILDEGSVRSYLSNNRYDVVINTAIYNPRVKNNGKPEKELSYDLQMFYILARCRELYGKMIYFGSGAEYDKRYPICSVREEEIGNTIPVNDYGLAKYIIGNEIDSGMYDNIYNLRIFGLFGKYENWRMAFISGACCKAIKNLPITIRRNVYFDYLFIDDFCRIVTSFLELSSPKYHTYNIVSGRRSLLSDIAKMVVRISGKDLPIYICNEGLANEYTASNQRIIEEIKDYSVEPMDVSIKKLYQWYKANEDMFNMEELLYSNR